MVLNFDSVEEDRFAIIDHLDDHPGLPPRLTELDYEVCAPIAFVTVINCDFFCGTFKILSTLHVEKVLTTLDFSSNSMLHR